MGEHVKAGAERFAAEREKIARLVHSTAVEARGDGLALLAILRLLERLHQDIREGLFQEALPQNRQSLYAMLKDMEAEGGWPYISRMKLRSLLESLPEGTLDAEHLEDL